MFRQEWLPRQEQTGSLLLLVLVSLSVLIHGCVFVVYIFSKGTSECGSLLGIRWCDHALLLSLLIAADLGCDLYDNNLCCKAISSSAMVCADYDGKRWRHLQTSLCVACGFGLFHAGRRAHHVDHGAAYNYCDD